MSNILSTKKLLCMNSDTANSKWWKYAPQGGCTEIVEVAHETAMVLCWKCTMRSTGGNKL